MCDTGPMAQFNPAAKAGNRGDVVKHAVLIAVLDELYAALPPGGGLSFYDAFSAGGEYQLQNTNTAEWKQGVGSLATKKSASGGNNDRVNRYLNESRNWSNPAAGVTYRGSSVIAAVLASKARRSVLVHAWDTDSNCIKQLKRVFKTNGHWQVLSAVHGTMPSGEAAGADLLFVDPPKRQGWEGTLKTLVPQGKEPNALMVWLPIAGNSQLASALPQDVMGPLWQIVVLWDTVSTNQKLVGCELLLVLPPAAWSAANDAVAQVVACMGKPWTVQSRLLS